MAGPPGAFVGGAVGVYMGYQTSDDYQPLIAAIREMTDDEKFEMQRRVQELVGSSLIEDFVSYIQNEFNRQVLLRTMRQATGKSQ